MDERDVPESGPGVTMRLKGSLHSGELPVAVDCPFCASSDTEQFSAFGSAVSTSQYYCNGCRTVFEFMKRRSRGRSG
jgi:ring-1,2-phenylacetyl-CoA epoxidase subunit PaaD